MSGQDNNSTPAARPRRASFSPAQPFTGLFSRPNPTAAGTNAYPGPIATAAANAQTRRRMSISTLGLSGTSPTQTSPFGSAASRRASVSSAGTGSVGLDESVIEETDGPVTAPASPLARRMSIGARVLRDVRTGTAAGNGLGPNGEGFNWSDSLRHRAERASSLSTSAPSPTSATAGASASLPRAQAPVSMPAPIQEMPKSRAPDDFQERILKGDFYMD